MKKIFIIALILMFIVSPAAGTEGIEYSNGPLGFSLTLPSSWEGSYSVHEPASNWADSAWVRFSNIRNDDAGYGGHVFSIFISDREPGDIPGMREILSEGGKTAYYLVPTDVQFDHNDRSLTNEYKKMESDIENIVGTFRFTTLELFGDADHIMRFAIFPTGTYGESYYFVLDRDGTLKCAVGTRKSDDIEQPDFLKTIIASSERKLGDEDLQIITGLANKLEASGHAKEKLFAEDCWDAALLYNGKVYEINIWLNDGPDEFLNLIKKIMELSPIPVNLHGWA